LTERRTSEFYNQEYYEKLGILQRLQEYQILKIKTEPALMQMAGYTRRWKPENALVIGCAFGFLVEALESLEHVPATGIDISEFAVNIAREKFNNHGVELGDVCEMRFGDDEFEYTICTRVLEEIRNEDIDKVVSEIIRVTNNIILISIARKPDLRYSFLNVHDDKWWIEKFQSKGVKLIFQDTFDTDYFLVFEVSS